MDDKDIFLTPRSSSNSKIIGSLAPSPIASFRTRNNLGDLVNDLSSIPIRYESKDELIVPPKNEDQELKRNDSQEFDINDAYEDFVVNSI